jgi:hypothetical protein
LSEREKYENALLTLRFTGEHLSLRGVTIYDLGNTLLATQRIINKAYLSLEDRLTKGAFPKREEREFLSFQLGDRRRESDAFALVPILSDPSIQANLKVLCDYLISGVIGYYTSDVLDRLKKEKDQDKKIFIGSIYTEVANIVNRIDAAGGVEGISIGSPALGRETFAAFNSETKEYLNEIKNEYFLGSYQEIKGRVYKLYPASKIVAIRRSGGNTVSIFLNTKDFETIRYHRETNPLFLFKGHPRYRFGVETKAVSEFEADEIKYLSEEG